MALHPLHPPSEPDSYTVDLAQIFIGRKQQLEDFEEHLRRWKNFIYQADSDQPPAQTVPTPGNKIQGLVVLLYGHGGFGKSILLRRFRSMVLEANQNPLSGKIIVSEEENSKRIVDWGEPIEGKDDLFKRPSDQGMDASEYFRMLCGQLALHLNKDPRHFREYQKAVKAVEKVRDAANSALENVHKEDDRFSALRTWTIEGIVWAVSMVTPPPVGKALESDKSKKLAEDAVKLAPQIYVLLKKKLGNKLSDYMSSKLRLGLALGRDLFNLARDYPLLIFFDTYEAVDEGDELLRIVMGAAGPRVGWVIAGRDNLWAPADESERSLAAEYGYQDLVKPELGLSINFKASDVGTFTVDDIKDYFAQLREMVRCKPPLPEVKEPEARRILDITEGIPLAVKVAADLYQRTANLDIITEKVEGEREIVDEMVRRYLLHTRDDRSERNKLYGLALLRRTNQPFAVAAALGLNAEQVETNYTTELHRLHRRYSFIFTDTLTDKDHPLLHQEVRDFLRLWLLEEEHHNVPEIIAVNETLKEAHLKASAKLEKSEEYDSLQKRLGDEKWVGIYLDLIEQKFWLNSREAVRNYSLPFMITIAPYSWRAAMEVIEVGEFFEENMEARYREWWHWGKQSFASPYSSDRRLAGLHALLGVIAEDPLPLSFPYSVKEYNAKQEVIETIDIRKDCQEQVEAALWWSLGRAYRDRDDKDALAWYEKALSRLSQDDALREEIARYCWEIANKLHDKKRYGECLHFLNKAIELKPGYASARFSRADIYVHLRQFKRAVEELNQTFTSQPNDASVYNIRGNAYLGLRQFKLALDDYNEAIKRNPKFSVAYSNRGTAYIGLKQYRQALNDFDYAIKLDPALALAYAARSEVYTQFWDFSRAMNDLNTAIKLDGTLAAAYALRGTLHTADKDLSRALLDFNTAIELDPVCAEAYAMRGSLLVYQALALEASRTSAETDLNMSQQAARADLDRALELDPNVTVAYITRAALRLALEEYPEALTDLNCAIGLEPNMLAYATRGEAHFALKKYAEAIADYDKAIELVSRQVDAYREWRNVDIHTKESDDAIEEYKRAIESAFNTANTYAGRALAYLWLKKSRQAKDDYSHCYEFDPTDINAGWMAEWAGMGKDRPGIELAERLEKIAANSPENSIAYVCRAVALGLSGKRKEGLVNLEQSIASEPDDWDAYFWKGMLYYYQGRSQAAGEAIEEALKRELPPILLTPLYWLQKDIPEFFDEYAKPVLEKYGV